MEVMDAEFGLGMVEVHSRFALENVSGYGGPITQENVVLSFKHLQALVLHLSNAAAAAPDAEHQIICQACTSLVATYLPRQHALPEFNAEAMLGKNGARLLENIQR